MSIDGTCVDQVKQVDQASLCCFVNLLSHKSIKVNESIKHFSKKISLNKTLVGLACFEFQPLKLFFIDINECASSPCQNGGTCVDQVNQYTCQCAAGYSGTTCATSKKY